MHVQGPFDLVQHMPSLVGRRPTAVTVLHACIQSFTTSCVLGICIPCDGEWGGVDACRHALTDDHKSIQVQLLGHDTTGRLYDPTAVRADGLRC